MLLKELTADLGSLTQDNCLKWQMMSHYTLKGIFYCQYSKLSCWICCTTFTQSFLILNGFLSFPFLSFFYYLLRYLFELFQSLLVFSSSYFQSIMKQRERHEYENTKFACCTLVVIYYCTAGTYVHSLGYMKFVLGYLLPKNEVDWFKRILGESR